MTQRLCLKCCPRCRGDLVQESDLDRIPYYTCIQCGHSVAADALHHLTVRSDPPQRPLPTPA